MNRNNRLPYYVLALLVLLALIYRVANPPKPPIPGPLGQMPHWDSMTKVGEMGPWAVNLSGTMWAGAWNQKENGKIRSAVWIIDLVNKKAEPYEMDEGLFVSDLYWEDDESVRVLTANSDVPSEIRKSHMMSIDADKGNVGEAKEISPTIIRVLGRSPRAATSDGQALAVLLVGEQGRFRIAVLNGSDMSVAGKEAVVDVAASNRPGRIAAVDHDKAEYVVFSVVEGQIGGNDRFYLVHTKTGTVKQIFRAEDLPGRVEGIWVSPVGTLLVVSERDKFHRVKYDLATGKIEDLKPKTKLDLAKNWPDAPKNMMFVSYNGGYELDLETGAAKRLFDLTKLDRMTGYWREQVQDGRLYTRKDGNYTSVSALANAIDIRVINKNGSKAEHLLPRR